MAGMNNALDHEGVGGLTEPGQRLDLPHGRTQPAVGASEAEDDVCCAREGRASAPSFADVAAAFSLMAADDAFNWPVVAPELWNENLGPIIKNLALKGMTERGPIAPPPVIPPGAKFRPLSIKSIILRRRRSRRLFGEV